MILIVLFYRATSGIAKFDDIMSSNPSGNSPKQNTSRFSALVSNCLTPVTRSPLYYQVYYLVVTARDGAADPRIATATATVFVTDTEDEPPVFREPLYEVTVPENQPYADVIRVQVSDVIRVHVSDVIRVQVSDVVRVHVSDVIRVQVSDVIRVQVSDVIRVQVSDVIRGRVMTSSECR